jgi:phosphomevalonate kinase
MVSGEYVVLEGAPALVAAAAARAFITLKPRPPVTHDRSPEPRTPSLGLPELPPEVLLSRSCAERIFGALAMTNLELDTSALRSEGQKLGLGSSAAAAAATVAAIASAHGQSLHDPEVRMRLLPLALEGHASIAPEGSGADVAASTLGGFVRVRREGKALDARPIEWPHGIRLCLVWTGKPARTSDLVRVVKSFAARDASGYRRAIEPLHEAAAELLSAVERGDVNAAIECAAAHHDAMDLLGRSAGAPIVTPELTLASELARSVGGAAKPSGAGGGDVAIAFLKSEDARHALSEACRERGLTVLSLGLGDEGVRTEVC